MNMNIKIKHDYGMLLTSKQGWCPWDRISTFRCAWIPSCLLCQSLVYCIKVLAFKFSD